MQTNITCHRQYHDIYSTPTLSCIGRNSVVDGDLTNLFPCSQKEADTCLLLHVADAVRKGFRKVYVCTVNTDVMVLVIASSTAFELWIYSLWYWIIMIPQKEFVLLESHLPCYRRL